MYKVEYITDIEKIEGPSYDEKKRLKEITEHYPFRANSYYLSLIDWNDLDDPIRKIVIPAEEELTAWGRIDASNESEYMVVSGCEHKYRDTAILLATQVCGCYCRFCFRKRLFIKGSQREAPADLSEAISYISSTPSINNVLITGGDGLILSTKRLKKIIEALNNIDHVRVIRIGSKLLAFNPYRVLNDPGLCEMLSQYSRPNKQIYIMTHFNHPKEITDVSMRAIELIKRSGVVLSNQTPLLKGINDDPQILGDLFNILSYHGIPPYYVFINRPVIGNKEFSIPLVEAYRIFERARSMGSGLSKRARLAMSHSTGKIELAAIVDNELILRYQRFVKFTDMSKVFKIPADADIYWLDDDLAPMRF